MRVYQDSVRVVCVCEYGGEICASCGGVGESVGVVIELLGV